MIVVVCNNGTAGGQVLTGILHIFSTSHINGGARASETGCVLLDGQHGDGEWQQLRKQTRKKTAREPLAF
jgi:hypothetical protein